MAALSIDCATYVAAEFGSGCDGAWQLGCGNSRDARVELHETLRTHVALNAHDGTHSRPALDHTGFDPPEHHQIADDNAREAVPTR